MPARRNELTVIRGYDGTPLAKNCSTCDELKLIAEYRFTKRNGYVAECSECHNASTRKRRRRTDLCRDCSRPAEPGTRRCPEHRKNDLARQRKRYTERPELVYQYQRDRKARLRARTPEQIAADRQRLRPDGTKRCQAGHVAPLSAFYNNASLDDGLMGLCIEHSNARLLRVAIGRWEELDLWRCIYCDAPFEEVEHAIPRSRSAEFGLDDPDDINNLVPSCVACNRGPGGKFDRTPSEWMPDEHEAVWNIVAEIRDRKADADE